MVAHWPPSTANLAMLRRPAGRGHLELKWGRSDLDKMGKREKPDRACIQDFASFLRTTGRSAGGVDRWPEDEADGEIDAIIGSFAVQHTSVDSVSGGREADAQFKKVIRELEHDLAGTLGYALLITWHWSAVRKGQNWDATHDALRYWIVLGEPRKLADGRHANVEVPGVPFTLDIHKGGLDKFDGVRFARYDPRDGTLGKRLMDQLTGRHKKLPALARYRADGKTTVLLLESVILR